jgi:hypothetical protein
MAIKAYNLKRATALVWIAALLSGCASYDGQPLHRLDHDVVEAIPLNVFVLDFDPILKSRENKNLIEYCGWWFDSAESVVDDVLSRLETASHGNLDVNVVRYEKIDEFPLLKNGFQFTEPLFVESWEAANWWAFENGRRWYEYPDWPDAGGDNALDLEYYIDRFHLVRLVNEGEINEVIIVGDRTNAPMTTMFGSGAYRLHGDPIERDCDVTRITCFSKERAENALMHLGWSTEIVMHEVFKSSDSYGDHPIPESERNLWDNFTMYDLRYPGRSAAGTSLMAPNADGPFDVTNKREVSSVWRNWIDYPDLTGEAQPTSSLDWGNGEYEDTPVQNHMQWWYSLFPHVAGRDADGYSNNWWTYFASMNYVTDVDVFVNGSNSQIVEVDFPGAYPLRIEGVFRDGSRRDITDDVVLEYDEQAIGADGNRITIKRAGATELTVKRDGVAFSVTIHATSLR